MIDAEMTVCGTTYKMKEKSPLSLVGNSRHSYRVYGVYSYGNSCQTLRVTNISIHTRDDTGTG